MTEPLQQIVEALECGALWAAGSEAEPRIRAALALARSMKQGDGWQPMETAPKARILAVVDGRVRVVAWGKASHVPWQGYCLADQGPEDFDLCEPTLWKPYPVAPSSIGERA